MTKTRTLLLVVLPVLLALGAAYVYVYGRSTCPPPDWWRTLFAFVHRNYGCVFAY